MSLRVGLLGPPGREELARLQIRLEERGVEPVVLDSTADPRLEIDGARVEAQGVEISALRALMVIDLGLSLAPAARDGETPSRGERLAASRRRLACWNAALEAIGDRVRVVNPPAPQELHGLKPWESFVEGREGLPTPWTLAGNTPRSLARLPEMPEGWVSKSLIGGLSHTETFQPPEDETAARRVFGAGALMIQQRIVGENVRAFVVGDVVIGAAEITIRQPGEIDSRRGATRLRPVTLPKNTLEQVARTARRWGMGFAAIDLMRDPGGEYWILECNSAPFFVVFERSTAIDVSSRLADYLVGQRRATPALPGDAGPNRRLPSLS